MLYPNPQIYCSLRTIFVHVPKTAGTAIERTLLQGRKAVVGGHTSVMGFKSKYPEVFEEYFKFAIVRDPVDRFVSAFCYLLQQPVHPALNNQVVHDCGSLESFVRQVKAEPALLEKTVHLLPQHRFLCDPKGDILVDQIYFFEEMAQAWEDISERIGIPHVPLPKVNVSRRPDDLDISDEVISTVQHYYARDYALFGFERPRQAARSSSS